MGPFENLRSASKIRLQDGSASCIEKLYDSLSENEKVEKSFFTRYQYYYIRKKDFNIEKWWLGWSDEQ